MNELTSKEQVNFIEKLIHSTKNNQATYNFDEKFIKFPSYLRRAAISHSLGAVVSFKTLATTEQLTVNRLCMPVFYKKDMSDCSDLDKGLIYLKLYSGKDWIWHAIPCRRQDIKYLRNRFDLEKISAPTLVKHKRKHYELRFSFKKNVKFPKTRPQKILAVDLGINTDASCVIMDKNGTVAARKFINFPAEKDRIYRVVNRTRHNHSESLWGIYNNLADDHAIKVSKAIADFAAVNDIDTVVFEYLDIQKKKRGSRKQRLALWRKNQIQERCTHQLHLYGIRYSRINPWNTSRLAYDGSGEVERGIDGNYSICKFTTGKIYNADLGAAKNIGARYFLRLLKQEHPELEMPAPTQRTLNDLIQIYKILPGNRQVGACG